MGNFIKTQSSFTHGAVASEFYKENNINGLSELQNMDVTDSGGLSRRYGLSVITPLNDNMRLIAWSVSNNENYILLLGNGYLYIRDADGNSVFNLLAPWLNNAYKQIQYAQRFGSMIFVHPDYPPYILQKTGDAFTLNLYEFERNDSDMSINIPFMRFDDSFGVSITVSSNPGGNNYATFTTNKDFWTPDNVGTRIYMLNRQWLITAYTNARTVTAYVNGAYTIPSAPIYDWRESAFSSRRGWPCSITFHQDRLVYGGSRDYPSGVWLSQVGRHNNFDTGTGLDDEAIFITLLSAQRQQICTVVSSENLQILTNVGEWAISNKPLTPSSVNIKQHTSIGSITGRFLPPQHIEGATVFVSASGHDIRELSLDELGENYNATDLCCYSKHLMTAPIDMAYNNTRHQLFIVQDCGKMSVLTHNTNLGISAWAEYQTAGLFKSVAVIRGKTFVVVQRGQNYYLEWFNPDALSDPNGLAFTCLASGLPLQAGTHNVHKLRIRKITVRISNTKDVHINNKHMDLNNDIYNTDADGYTGDVSINVLGTSKNFMQMPWRISSCQSMPLNILSVTLFGFYTV